MGKKGFSQVAYLSAKNAQLLAKGLKEKGYKLLNNDFFNEFILEVENADKFIAKLKTSNIIAGYKLNEKQILVCTTETNSIEEINEYIKLA
jgi:glycine dehydrogenase subunit 1